MNGRTAAAAWEKRRKVLVHDLLKNHLSPILAKLRAILDKKVVDLTFIESLSDVLDNERYAIGEEIKWLVDNASDALSPKLLFTMGPLNNLDARTLEWLPDAVHELWTARVNLDEEIKAVKAVTAEFMAECEGLSARLSRNSDNECLASTKRTQRLCEELAVVLSGLRALLPPHAEWQ